MGHKKNQHTVRYSELPPTRFKELLALPNELGYAQID
jgi:hypothetical protein